MGPPATENLPGPAGLPGREPHPPSTTSPPAGQPQPVPSGAPEQTKAPELRIGKSLMLASKPGESNQDVFTLTLGGETIELLPFKNWIQLDHFKWTVRGKLPAEPAGLEIFPDHLRLMGETVSLNDPEGCLKLERHFNEWLSFERETLELARKKLKAQAAAVALQPAAVVEPQGLRFRVETDKRGQVHIHAEQGRNTLASVGLTVAGLKSLCQQGLMRKPQRMETGALHDWVELDGELCSFEKGRNDAARLEQLLNERYIPPGSVGGAKEVLITLNAASSTGFDIQFPVKLAGVADNHRDHLNDHALELLMDPEHCGLLHKQIIVKLIPPNLVFKQRTPDGGEQYLAWGPETAATVSDEDGHQKSIQLSQPLNLLRLSPAELTAVFNHPCINRHSKTEPAATPAAHEAATTVKERPRTASSAQTQPQPAPVETPRQNPTPIEQPSHSESPGVRQQTSAPAILGATVSPMAVAHPNLWLKDILAQPALPHDWRACLTYSKVAERFGNSSEGKFGAGKCWFISLGEAEDIEAPEFKGVFLTEKGSLGFLNEGQMARFYNGVAFIGARHAALEAIQVNLVALGLDANERIVFIISDDYREKFDVPETTLTEVLALLGQAGAMVMSVSEILAHNEPLEVVWTAPVTQLAPEQPEALEHTRPVATQ